MGFRGIFFPEVGKLWSGLGTKVRQRGPGIWSLGGDLGAKIMHKYFVYGAFYCNY